MKANFYSSFWFSTLIGFFLLSCILCFFLRKKKSFAYWLIHLGLFMIIGGAFLTSSFSFRKTIEVEEGKNVHIPQTNYYIKLIDFNITYYQDKETPKEFRSDIILYKDKRKVTSSRIMVNHPFSFEGFTFFQKGYGIADCFFVLDFEGEEFLVKNGWRFKKDKAKIEILDFLPDFVIMDGVAKSRSYDFNNPALKVRIEKDNKIKTGWVFLNFPEYHLKETSLKFKSIIPDRYFSHIEIVKDPGMPLVFLGFLLITGGLWKYFLK